MRQKIAKAARLRRLLNRMRPDLPAPSLAQNRGVREVRGKVREVETGQGVRADDNEINMLRGFREVREFRELVCKVPRVRARD
jgi:hypothetical protein